MAELGTIYFGKDIVGIDVEFGHLVPTIGIETAFGRIEASIVGDPGIYDEIGVDLIAPDGRRLQLATIGVTENDAGIEEFGGEPEMHAYVWNGTEEDCKWAHDIAVGDDSHWY